MPRNPNKRRCSRAGCRAWALRGGMLCSAHSRPARPLPACGTPPEDVQALPTLDSEILHLVEWRRNVEKKLAKRMNKDGFPPLEGIRCLNALTQVSKAIMQLIVQRTRAGSNEDEVLRFLEDVELRVREMRAAEANTEQPLADGSSR